MCGRLVGVLAHPGVTARESTDAPVSESFPLNHPRTLHVDAPLRRGLLQVVSALEVISGGAFCHIPTPHARVSCG